MTINTNNLFDEINANPISEPAATEPAEPAATEPAEPAATEPAETALSLVDVDKDIFKVQAADEGAAIRFTTTFDDVELFNAVNGGSETVRDYIDQEIECENMVVTSADVHEDINDDDSPIVSKPCVHFYTTDGKHLATLSNGIVRSAKNLISCGLAPNPDKPRKIKFKKIMTPKGEAFTFDLIKN